MSHGLTLHIARFGRFLSLGGVVVSFQFSVISFQADQLEQRGSRFHNPPVNSN